MVGIWGFRGFKCGELRGFSGFGELRLELRVEFRVLGVEGFECVFCFVALGFGVTGFGIVRVGVWSWKPINPKPWF